MSRIILVFLSRRFSQKIARLIELDEKNETYTI